MGTQTISFPALWSCQDVIHMIDTFDSVTECTKAGFKSGFYKSAFLIDSNYDKFQVMRARKVRSLFKFDISDLLGILEANPRWQVELILHDIPQKSSLDEVKRIIFNDFTRNKDSWEEMTDFEESRDKIASAMSMEEVFAVFKEFHHA